MKKTSIKLIVILLVLPFCFSCNFYSDRDLGSNYMFWEDGNQSEIIYHKSGKNGGGTIVEANVSQYNFNDKYIIAKSNWLTKNGDDAYWIIDKSIEINKDTSKKGEQCEHELKKGLLGPLSKDSFNFLIQKYNINLKLKDARK